MGSHAASWEQPERSERSWLRREQDEAARTRAAREEREHDVRSALMAMDVRHERSSVITTAWTPTAGRCSLARSRPRWVGCSGSIVEPAPEANEPFGVADVLRSVTALASVEGLAVEVGGSRSLLAVGRPEHTARIVRTLLDNAHVHAPGSPVQVHIGHRANSSWSASKIGVQASTPTSTKRSSNGVVGATAQPTAQARSRPVDRGPRLATAQGGAWVENRPGGGASFVLRLQRA